MKGEGEEPLPGDAFHLAEDGPDDPRPILKRLVDELEEFNVLRVGEAAFMTVLRTEEKVRQGRLTIGTMALPRFTGPQADFATWCLAMLCGGDLPDYILTIDSTWWAQANPMEREALVYHELCHCAQATDRDGEPKFTDEGLPVWAIQGHDIEEFHAVIRRYGAWGAHVSGVVDALAEHKVRQA